MDGQSRVTIKDIGEVKLSSLCFNVELKYAEFLKVWPYPGAERREAGCTPLQVAAVHELHTVCARTPGRGDLVQKVMKVCKLLWCSAPIHIKRVPGISVAFKNMVLKIPAELGGQPGAPSRTKGEAILAAGPPLGPYLGKTSETELCFLRPLSPPLLFFTSMFVGRRRFLLKYLVLLNLVINLML